MSTAARPLLPASPPSYLFLTAWESGTDVSGLRSWLSSRFYLSILGSFSYIVTLITLRYIMRDRPPMQLRKTLFAWNLLLSLFSIASTIRMSEFISSTWKRGLRDSLCNQDDDPVANAWMLLFVYSKVAEFFDTVFLILRKKPIIFLHTYHHAIVLPLTWILFATGSPLVKYATLMNVAVHSIMYAYYAAQAIGIRVSNSVATVITCTQITQMAVGLILQSAACYFGLMESPDQRKSCFRHDGAAAFLWIAYASFLYLFGQFFVKRYCSTPTRKAGDRKKE